MSEVVDYTVQDQVAIITINNPPVNALSPGVPEGIIDGLEKANKNDDVTAVVLIGSGRTFIAGADIKNMNKGVTTARPRNEHLSVTIENSPKPVIAAIHGFALGGGLETALGCHYRIAEESAKVGLPEVTIGILPGGTGTQRLPRLIGPQAALDMIVSGRHVPVPEAAKLGLIDKVVSGVDSLKLEAIKFAIEMIGQQHPKTSLMEIKIAAFKGKAEIFDAKRKSIARKTRNQNAAKFCILCVEASVNMSFEEGCVRERELFGQLVQSDEAKGLRYAFFAERECRKLPDVPKNTPIIEIEHAAVIGGGTMGTGIAMCLANAGIKTQLLEINPDALVKALERIESTYAISVKRGSMSEVAKENAMSCISGVTDYEEISDAQMAIEAVFEDMDVKKAVFSSLEQVLSIDAILATNSSALDIDEIADSISRPEQVLGMHFFSPANVMELLEVVKANKTSKRVIASTMALAKVIGKKAVVCGNCDGFVANRSRLPFSTEVNLLIEEGASVEQVDRVMFEFGYPMGPLAVADLAGGDIGYAGRKRREAVDASARKLPIADCLVEMNRLGQKTSAGWYNYKEGDRTPYPAPEVDKVIAETQQELGVEPRSFTDEEILHRILFASVNEVCKIVEEGIAYRASDVDVMWMGGFGYPRYRGGLMFWADQIGVKHVYEQIKRWSDEFGGHWKPSELLEQLAASDKSFKDI
ncbi:MAG: 3-hydroxyacyl-CoA dehydrogenase [Candidatus Azotimanducaceae bacterium]|jgi:3-hydroxyacyl-CoA dehydrogenase